MKTIFFFIGILGFFRTATSLAGYDEERLSKLEASVAFQTEYIEILKQTVNSHVKIISKLQNEIVDIKEDNRIQNQELLLLKSMILQMNGNNNQELNITAIRYGLQKPQSSNSLKDKKVELELIGKETKNKRLLVTPNIISSTVGFYAFLSKEETTVGPHHTIIFDQVITNVGEAYNKHAGDFVVPVTGVYVLSYTIVSGWSSSIHVELVINGNVDGASLADSGTYSFDGTAASTVVLSLNQGDTCLVRTHQTTLSHGVLWSAHYARSSFSGWKISP